MREVVLSEFISEWALKIVETLGYVGVFLLIAIENLIPPIPSELILPLAGFSVGRGELTFPGVMIASTCGSVVGALVLYYIGAVIGEARLRRFIRRVEQMPILNHLVNEGDIDKAQDWFGRYGGATVFFGRLIPIVRSAISIPAGFARMNLVKFVAYSFVGSSIWNGILIGAGWFVGDNWHSIEQYVKYFQYLVIVVVGVAVLWFIWRRWSGRDTARAAATSSEAQSSAARRRDAGL
jgi:membrane protein DedA with SNARE-associated domain